MKLRSFLLAMMLCVLCCAPAHALEYDFDAPEDYLFGQPTSDDTIYEWENPNVDRSKNTTLVAPGFGTPTSYLPGSGEYPFALCGFFTYNGMTFEKFLLAVIRSELLYPRKLVFRAENLYVQAMEHSSVKEALKID